MTKQVMKAAQMLGVELFTAKKDNYKLYHIERVGKSTLFHYEWTNPTPEAKALFNCRFQSKTECSPSMIAAWIESLKQQTK